MRYLNHTIEETPTDKFPTMVTITKGTKKGGLVGRKFITQEKAVIAIDVMKAEATISKGEKGAKDYLVELGLREVE